MNILPFVTILIFVISLIISSFFQGYKESALSKLGFTGAITAHRLARNDAEHAKFKASLPKPKPDESKSQTPSGKQKKSFRKQITDNSKFNLSPLLKNESPFLEEVFAKLLHELYPNFPTKALAKELLIAMKKLPESFTFEEILLPGADLNQYWYKMLKGSPGWPTISHYVTLRKEKDVIMATKASIPLHKAFFGEEITEAARQGYRLAEGIRTRLTITTA